MSSDLLVLFQTFEAMRSKMLDMGKVFLEKMMSAREKIAKKGAERLPDGAVSPSLPALRQTNFYGISCRNFWFIRDHEQSCPP